MATRKLDQTDRMLQAGGQGNQAVQRAQESRTRNVQTSRNRKETARQFDESTRQRELDRFERQHERDRADRQFRDKERAYNQAQKADTTIFGGKGRADRAAADAASQINAQTEAKQDARYKSEQSLEAAKAGLMKSEPRRGPTPTPQRQGAPSLAGKQQAAATPATGSAAQPPAIPPGTFGEAPASATQVPGTQSADPRTAQLQKEMYPGMETQGRASMESTRPGGEWVQDPNSYQAQQSQRADEAEATKRINAVANLQRATNSLRIAEIKGAAATSAASKKHWAEQQEFQRKTLMVPVKGAHDLLQRMMTNKGTLADWNAIKAELKNQQDVGGLAARKQAAENSIWDDSLQSFMEERLAVKALKYIAGVGEVPTSSGIEKKPLIDPSSEAMQKFYAAAPDAKHFLNMQGLTNPQMGMLLNVTSYDERVRMINRMAAEMVLKQMMGPEKDPNPSREGAKAASTPTHDQRAGPQGVPPAVPGGSGPGQVTAAEAKRRAEEPVPYEPPDADASGLSKNARAIAQNTGFL